MAEYLEREKVLKELDMMNGIGDLGDSPDCWRTGWDDAITSAIAEMKKLPAADVRPERHGKWIYLDEGIHECSECGAWLDRPPSAHVYCWKCGAKMDGEEGEDGDGNG